MPGGARAEGRFVGRIAGAVCDDREGGGECGAGDVIGDEELATEGIGGGFDVGASGVLYVAAQGGGGRQELVMEEVSKLVGDDSGELVIGERVNQGGGNIDGAVGEGVGNGVGAAEDKDAELRAGELRTDALKSPSCEGGFGARKKSTVGRGPGGVGIAVNRRRALSNQ